MWEGLEVSHCCQQRVARRRESKEQATATTLTATKEDKSIDSGIVTCLEEMVPCLNARVHPKLEINLIEEGRKEFGLVYLRPRAGIWDGLWSMVLLGHADLLISIHESSLEQDILL